MRHGLVWVLEVDQGVAQAVIGRWIRFNPQVELIWSDGLGQRAREIDKGVQAANGDFARRRLALGAASEVIKLELFLGFLGLGLSVLLARHQVLLCTIFRGCLLLSLLFAQPLTHCQ